MSARSRVEVVVAAALLAAISLAFVLACQWMAWPVVDDAGISLAFGRTFFEGHGFRVTPLSQPVEGFSSPLWALALGLQRFTGADPERWMWWSGVLAGALALPTFALWGPAAAGRALRVEDALAPALAALNPSFAAWCSSGMETGLWALALGLSGLVVLRAMRLGRGYAAGAVLAGLLLVRPEAPLFAAALAPLWLGVALAAKRNPLREAGQALSSGLLVASALLALRWLYFADLVPNTWWAKRLWGFDGASYVGSYFTTYGATLLAVAAGLAATAWRRQVLPQTLLGAAWCGAALYFARANGDWMGEWRFVVPAVPLLAVVVGGGVAAALDRFRRGGTPRRRELALVTALVVVALAVPGAVQAKARWAAVKAAPQFPFSFTVNQFNALKPQLEALKQRRPLLAYPDMGGQAWALRDAELMDVAGLCDRAAARHANNYPAIDDYFATEGPPLLIDGHGPSGHVVHFAKLLAQMQPAGGPFWIASGVTPLEDARCPGGKAQVLALTPEALLGALKADLDRGEAITAIRRWRCAWAYQSDEALPARAALGELAEAAMAKSRQLEAAGQLEPALRHASAATVLSGQSPHYRRWTEQLRERLFPRK